MTLLNIVYYTAWNNTPVVPSRTKSHGLRHSSFTTPTLRTNPWCGSLANRQWRHRQSQRRQSSSMTKTKKSPRCLHFLVNVRFAWTNSMTTSYGIIPQHLHRSSSGRCLGRRRGLPPRPPSDVKNRPLLAGINKLRRRHNGGLSRLLLKHFQTFQVFRSTPRHRRYLCRMSSKLSNR